MKGRRLAVYVFLCLVWGSTWLVIKIGLKDLPPLRYAGLRMGLACLVLAPFAFLGKGVRPTRHQALLIAWSGFLQIGLSYAFVFYASQWIESGLVALLFSTFIIFVGLFGHFMLPDEPFTRRAVVAALVGLAGVAVIEAPGILHVGSADTSAVLAGGGLMLGSAIVSAYTNILNKRSFADVSPPLNVWIQTLVGSAALLAASALLEGGLPSRWTPGSVAALLYLAVVGTALAFVGLFWLIPRVPVGVVGSIPLVDTLLAVALGAAVLGERLSLRVLAGGALILLGVGLAMRSAAPASDSRTTRRARAGTAGTRGPRDASGNPTASA